MMVENWRMALGSARVHNGFRSVALVGGDAFFTLKFLIIGKNSPQWACSSQRCVDGRFG